MRLLAFLIALLTASAAFAQTTPMMPFVFPVTVGVSSGQAIGQNAARKRIMFANASLTATIYVCPAISRKDGAAVACTAGAAGSIPLLPTEKITLDGQGGNPTVPTAWNAVASAGSTPLTVLEWE